MDYRLLEKSLEDFKKSERNENDYQDVNAIRKSIFDSYENNKITERDKNSLLKSLYKIADFKNIFFIEVVARNTRDLPKNQEEEEARKTEAEDDESYEEESYEESFDESDDESVKSS